VPESGRCREDINWGLVAFDNGRVAESFAGLEGAGLCLLVQRASRNMHSTRRFIKDGLTMFLLAAVGAILRAEFLRE
jgi:hypothetical protein